MTLSTRIIRALLLAAAAAALAVAAFQLREKHQEAEQAVQDIHDQLDALDPATRAAVVARLTAEEVKKVRDHQPPRVLAAASRVGRPVSRIGDDLPSRTARRATGPCVAAMNPARPRGLDGNLAVALPVHGIAAPCGAVLRQADQMPG